MYSTLIFAGACAASIGWYIGKGFVSDFDEALKTHTDDKRKDLFRVIVSGVLLLIVYILLTFVEFTTI